MSAIGGSRQGRVAANASREVLRSNIVNYSRDCPYVWDEITIGVANESDLAYTMQVFQRLTRSVLGESMAEPAARYRQLLREAKLSFDVEEEPSLYLSPADAWTNCTIRYLVPARERRRWATNLLLAISQESARSEHRGRIITAYPRMEVQLRQSGSNADAIQSEAGKEPLVVQRK